MKTTAIDADPPLTGSPATSRDDVVDVLIAQHRQVEQQLTQIAEARGPQRQHQFRYLCQLLSDHHRGERVVVYPVVSDHTAGGSRIAVRDLASGERIVALAADINRRGTEQATYPAAIAALRETVRAHVDYDEREVFPLLRRYIPVQRLHLMANQLRNVQTMR